MDLVYDNCKDIGEDINIYNRYDSEVNEHIEKLASIFTLQEKAAQYFKKLPLHIQINLKGRYDAARELLEEIKSATIKVPAGIDTLFKWFFIEFWYNSDDYIFPRNY
ncbi:hypothetical protein G7K71_08465 [Desulfofundulus sp. TPOSR]|uniref:hypothetical protein n=1 Tax=Desulfofundulus sp. TPOSR TaxID=2714340 RepID=UPI00140C4F62|nr:hypothetical protein [Desulfofundulus sp. TPOSR]NHM25427.1 hypothetical protein [Desulfofundulus sp. TPOSR]NHM27016.1 hypothetical protein [Desulfofundulus sp. TPOSR]